MTNIIRTPVSHSALQHTEKKHVYFAPENRHSATGLDGNGRRKIL